MLEKKLCFVLNDVLGCSIELALYLAAVLRHFPGNCLRNRVVDLQAET